MILLTTVLSGKSHKNSGANKISKGSWKVPLFPLVSCSKSDLLRYISQLSSLINTCTHGPITRIKNISDALHPACSQSCPRHHGQLLPQSLATTDPFPVSMILPFQNVHIKWNQSMYPLSLASSTPNNPHMRVLRVSWESVVQFFCFWVVLYGCLMVCLFMRWWIFGLSLDFSDYEWRSTPLPKSRTPAAPEHTVLSESAQAGFSMSVHFHFLVKVLAVRQIVGHT